MARVACSDYVPTPVDVLRARLETIGIEEHHISMETGEEISFESELTNTDSSEAEAGQEWIFYDIEGSRSHKGIQGVNPFSIKMLMSICYSYLGSILR